ncbi:MAG: hypothetical protein M3135_05460 [Actinomycetota bacterium]|nr:hypothetical protein [Actinomycetota bacterium]
MVSDRDRRHLYEALNLSLGDGPASTLMELLPPVGWADVARQSDLGALRGEMAELRAELTGEMAGLKAELRGEMAELRAHVDAQLTRFLWGNVHIMCGVSGLVLAAAKLA